MFIPLATGFALIAFDNVGHILLTGVIRQVVSFTLTLALWTYFRRWPAETFRLATHVVQIVLACVVVTVVDTGIVELIRAALKIEPSSSLAQLGSVPLRLSIYLAWTSIYFMIRQEMETRSRGLRLAQIELAAREAELASLRAQVNPHFLFNALNSILAESKDGAPAARAITRSLADYLRAALLQRDHYAPLGDEVDSIAAYLNVEKARFEERLVHTFAIEPAARDAVVPITVLLPLVENAVKYGMRTSPSPLRINISAMLCEDLLTLTVENSGHWFETLPDATDSTQIGLTNLRRRLALLFGDGAALTIYHDTERVRIEVTLPTGLHPLLKDQNARKASAAKQDRDQPTDRPNVRS